MQNAGGCGWLWAGGRHGMASPSVLVCAPDVLPGGRRVTTHPHATSLGEVWDTRVQIKRGNDALQAILHACSVSSFQPLAVCHLKHQPHDPQATKLGRGSQQRWCFGSAEKQMSCVLLPLVGRVSRTRLHPFICAAVLSYVRVVLDAHHKIRPHRIYLGFQCMVRPGGHVIMFHNIYPVMDDGLLVSQLAHSTILAGSSPLSLYVRRITNQSVEPMPVWSLSPRDVHVPFEMAPYLRASGYVLHGYLLTNLTTVNILLHLYSHCMKADLRSIASYSTWEAILILRLKQCWF